MLRTIPSRWTLWLGLLALIAGANVLIAFRSAGSMPVSSILVIIMALSLGYFGLESQRLRASSVRAADELRAKEWFAVTLSSIGDAVLTTDTDGRITFMNPVAETLTGWPADQARGHNYLEIFRIVSGATRAPVEGPLAQAIDQGAVTSLAKHTLLVRRDGTSIPIDDSGAPICDRAGTILGAVLIFRDIRERRRAEETQQQLYQEAQTAIGVRDEFLSIAAHELKTPLTTMLGHVQLILRRAGRDGGLSERDQRSLTTVEGQAERLNTMIGQLFDSTQLERGHLRISRAPLDLAGLLWRVSHELQSTVAGQRVIYEATDEPLVVDGDAMRLEQVFQNLIANAAKYDPAGGPVHIRLERRGDVASIAVSDQGIGVPAAELPEIFQRFYRASNAAGRRIGGLGIGLYIVREIVMLHGGTIAVESSEGQGSTFTIALPLATPVGLALGAAAL